MKDEKRATVTNIRKALETSTTVRVRHHIGDSFLIDDVKPMRSGQPMVHLHRGAGWTLIDPRTWEVQP